MGWFRGRRARGVAVEILGLEKLHQRVSVGLTETEPVAWPFNRRRGLADNVEDLRAECAINRRCQRSSVCDLTSKHDQRALGSTRLTAASRVRSVGSRLGHGSWRPSTPSWLPSTRISKSLAASPRASIARSWLERQSVK